MAARAYDSTCFGKPTDMSQANSCARNLNSAAWGCDKIEILKKEIIKTKISKKKYIYI